MRLVDGLTVPSASDLADFLDCDPAPSDAASWPALARRTVAALARGVPIVYQATFCDDGFSEEPFFIIDTAFLVESREPISWRWAYYELKRIDLNAMDSGSAIPSTSRDQFYRLSLCVPPCELQERFEISLARLMARRTVASRESTVLAQTRDSLLPRLLSGELSVPATDAALEATA